jgi:hypothetical protein
LGSGIYHIKATPHRFSKIERRAGLFGGFFKERREYSVYARAFLGNLTDEDVGDTAAITLWASP